MNCNTGIQYYESPSLNISLNVQWSLLNVCPKPLKKAKSHTHQYLHIPPLCAQFALLPLGQGLREVATWPSADTYVQEYVCRNACCTWAWESLGTSWMLCIYRYFTTYTLIHTLTYTRTYMNYSWILQRPSSPVCNHRSLSCHIFSMVNSRAALTRNPVLVNFSSFWQEKRTFLNPGQGRR